MSDFSRWGAESASSVEAVIRELVELWLAGPDALGLAGMVRATGSLPVWSGPDDTLLIGPNGAVLRYERGRGIALRHEYGPAWRALAYAKGAEMDPRLRALVRPRDPNAVTCGACAGDGSARGLPCEQCSGRGWIVPRRTLRDVRLASSVFLGRASRRGAGCLFGAFLLVMSWFLFVLALIGFFGVVVQIVDPGGGRSGRWARSQVTTSLRFTMGAVFGVLGLGASIGCWTVIQMYVRHMGNGNNLGEVERALDRRAPFPRRTDDPMWDRDIDG